MAFGDAGIKSFGLREIVLINAAGTAVALNAAQTLTFKERLKSGELAGNDATLAVVSFSDAVEWELEEGGISLKAYALLTGRTTTLAGSGAAETLTMVGDAAQAFPYIKIYGRSLGDAGDDVHVKLWKAKVVGGLEGQFADGEFFVTKCSGLAIDDGTNGIYSVIHNETAAALPTS